MEAEPLMEPAAPMVDALTANETASTPTASEPRPLLTVEVMGETITVIGHRHFLVASHSHPGDWYSVEEDGCTCRAADCNVECRHLRAIRRLLACQTSTPPTA